MLVTEIQGLQCLISGEALARHGKEKCQIKASGKIHDRNEGCKEYWGA